jgi:hypothetical protein
MGGEKEEEEEEKMEADRRKGGNKGEEEKMEVERRKGMTNRQNSALYRHLCTAHVHALLSNTPRQS